MAANFSDKTIENLLCERKPLPLDYEIRIKLKDKRGHKEKELDVVGADGNMFRMLFRQSNINPLDFSVILAYLPPGTNVAFRLRRYNGKSHEHTNKIESETFYDFHIHTATERYQRLGMSEESFAVVTDRYADFQGALSCMLSDCGFELPTDGQMKMEFI